MIGSIGWLAHHTYYYRLVSSILNINESWVNELKDGGYKPYKNRFSFPPRKSLQNAQCQIYFLLKNDCTRLVLFNICLRIDNRILLIVKLLTFIRQHVSWRKIKCLVKSKRKKLLVEVVETSWLSWIRKGEDMHIVSPVFLVPWLLKKEGCVDALAVVVRCGESGRPFFPGGEGMGS